MYDMSWEKMTIRNHLISLVRQGLAAEMDAGRYVRI